MNSISESDRISRPQKVWTFPFQYRNILTLVVGADRRKYYVHRELLQKKSKVVTRHLGLGNKLRIVEEALMEQLCLLEALPQVDHADLPTRDWHGGSFFPTDETSRAFLKVDGIFCQDRERGSELRMFAAEILNINTSAELENKLYTFRPESSWLRVHRFNSLVTLLVAYVRGELRRHRSRMEDKPEAMAAAQDMIELQHTEPRLVEMMMHHLYTGEFEKQTANGEFVVLSTMDLVQLYDLGHYLEMLELVEEIEEELKSRAQQTPSMDEFNILQRIANDAYAKRPFLATMDREKYLAKI